MPESKSQQQVKYLLSKASPLTNEQRERLKKELHTGRVIIKKSKKK